MILYIDPGTGSMLFTIIIGLLGTLFYLFRDVFVRLRFLLSGGAKQGERQSDSLPFVIFSDSKRYWNTFKPICDEFEKRGLALEYMTASPDDPALEQGYSHVKCSFIGEGNRAFAKLNFLKADVLLSTTPGLDVYQWKRSKDVKFYVHVLHAPNDSVIYRMFGLDYYDGVLLSGEYQVRQQRELERLRGLGAKELVVAGLPYMDGLLHRLEAEGGAKAPGRRVLLAPSWGESGILTRFGAEMIEALLDTGYEVIVRPHPQSFVSEKELMEKLMGRYPDSEQLKWNRDNDNFAALRDSDILISDFSGVIFDYSLVFKRPVIYADVSFDKAPYDACWLEDEIWTLETLPKIGRQLCREDFPNLKAIIDELIESPAYSQAIETARQETWANPGRSAGIIADYMVKKQAELTANK